VLNGQLEPFGDRRARSGHRIDAQHERHQRIRQLVNGNGFVSTDELAATFGVSVITMRRDLDALRAGGWIRRVPGGAAALPLATLHPNVARRMLASPETKTKLAAAALSLVSPGQTVMLDESTTCLHLAHRLPERAPLTVITHFLSVVKVLAGKPGITLVTLGGTYEPAYDSFLGLHTAEAVASFRADLLVASTRAISGGECYQSEETVHVKRAMMEHTGRRILLADHRKFSRESAYFLAAITEFDVVFTDEGTPLAQRQRMWELGVNLRVV
jgi:DeoR/GlpR family transcriptional regulator of sugar metabolism